MTKDHKLRIACAGLSGKQREQTMLALLQHPERLDKAIKLRMNYPHRDGARRPRPVRQRKDVNVSVRLTYQDYIELKQRAKTTGMTIASLFRLHLVSAIVRSELA